MFSPGPCLSSLIPQPGVEDSGKDSEALEDGTATRWEEPASPDQHVAGGLLNTRLHCAVKNTFFFLVRLSNWDLGAVCYSSEATLTCAGSWRCEKQKVNLETTSSLNSGIPWD